MAQSTIGSFTIFVMVILLSTQVTGMREIDGNWYGNTVKAIKYTNVGTPGTYNEVIEMAQDGTCKSAPKAFSGPLAPLNEEVSLHFRGPVAIKQIAVYMPANSDHSKRQLSGLEGNRHNHQNVHERAINKQKREDVTATINGAVVIWENNWFGGPQSEATSTTSAAPEAVTANIDGKLVSWVNNWFGGTSSQLTTASPKPAVTEAAKENPAAPAPANPTQQQVPEPSEAAHPSSIKHASSSGSGAPGTYERIGYYDSASQSVDNLVFLGNFGGQGSGIFDYNFGASLSYTNCDGNGGASSPQILVDATIPSDHEVIVMLAQDCGDSGCGYTRPGAVAYHGFDGADKVFLFEFSMPMDGEAGFSGDMPAIWMLNANIPRTLQYGKPECSCWTSGCGEFDIVEALNDGSTYLKSTFHTNTPGGDSNYFARPVSGTMKLAVVFDSTNSTAQIQVLKDDFSFDDGLTLNAIEDMCSSNSQEDISNFAITP